MLVARRLLHPLALAAAILLLPLAAAAQEPEAPTEGFVQRVASDATGQEITAQSNLWVLEVDLKPLRMIWVDVTDPETGQKKRELVWYLVYKAVNRPLARRQDTSDSAPANEEDVPPGKPLFVPDLTLVTDDNDSQQVYPDVVLPEAQAAINRRERRRFLNSVEAIGEIPDPVPADARPTPEQVIYGVATWKDVDPETDYFTVYMSGFSNGIRVMNGPDGKPLVLRKTIMQDFWRPGDRFDQTEDEVRFQGEPRWDYRPDAPGATVLVPNEATPPAAAPAGQENAAPPAQNDGAAPAPAAGQ
ncbi:MAG: hypothetical protein KY476_21055 [Planctomycetes bacterium]|nr:hypothetical protein [Planctomycetota bacterium]